LALGIIISEAKRAGAKSHGLKDSYALVYKRKTFFDPFPSFFLADYRATEELKADTSVAYLQAYDSSASSNVDSTVPTSVPESVPGTTGRETKTSAASSTDVEFSCSRITDIG
jgi:hypothetical protein